MWSEVSIPISFGKGLGCCGAVRRFFGAVVRVAIGDATGLFSILRANNAKWKTNKKGSKAAEQPADRQPSIFGTSLQRRRSDYTNLHSGARILSRVTQSRRRSRSYSTTCPITCETSPRWCPVGRLWHRLIAFVPSFRETGRRQPWVRMQASRQAARCLPATKGHRRCPQ